MASCRNRRAITKSHVDSETPRTTPPDTVPVPEADGEFDLDDPALYLNRELTWLNFNYRVLAEAADERVPLLERLKFVAIVSSNLDEFFMKRIGGLKQQVGAGLVELSEDGRTPQQQIDECYAIVRDLEFRKRAVFLEVALALLEHDIVIAGYDDLDEEDQEAVRRHYVENIYPLVTPQATDPAHPFPFISNLSLNLLVTLRLPGDPYPSLARVKVPVGTGTPRFVSAAGQERVRAARAGDGREPRSPVSGNGDRRLRAVQGDPQRQHRAGGRRGGRSAGHDRDGAAASEGFAPIVRLEVAPGMDPVHRGMLAAEFGLDEEADVFEMEGMLGLARPVAGRSAWTHPNSRTDRTTRWTTRRS